MNCVVIRNIFKILLLPITETSNHVITYVLLGPQPTGDETRWETKQFIGEEMTRATIILNID